MSCVFGETAGEVAAGLVADAALDGDFDEPPQAPATNNNASAKPTGRGLSCIGQRLAPLPSECPGTSETTNPRCRSDSSRMHCKAPPRPPTRLRRADTRAPHREWPSVSCLVMSGRSVVLIVFAALLALGACGASS